MPRPPTDVLQGTLDMLVLKALSLQPMHGWGITQRIEQLAGGALAVNPGSLYPALQRLLDRGWIAAEWERTENNRRAKYYHLTTLGRKQLGLEQESWRRFVNVVDGILHAT
jgi:PadR family transcriptional regulator, regulatory protein PadR